jgi:2-polyprenyl-3-methyl-5-hydroxy-6-metoxy-1,4-benzoquinol methylase
MFAELVGKEFPHARIIAVDLSEKNIEYARSTVNASNVMLKVASVTDQFVVLREMAGGSIDAFCLIDVIEHIQVEARAKMLVRMAESSSESAVLILAYPSAEYQRYLMGHDPSELQIIDNVVEIATLIQEAEQAGWYLKEFRYVDLWMTNQYIHAAFEKRLEVERRQTSVSFVNKLKFHFDRVFLKRRRVGRYGRVLDTNATGL